MIESARDVTTWLKAQQDIVVSISAYIAPIKGYVARCATEEGFADDMNGVYQLHTIVQNWNGVSLIQALQGLGLHPYYKPLGSPQGQLVRTVTAQTIPSTKRPADVFLAAVSSSIDAMAETVVALAKVPPPPFSVTLAAGTPFDAYILLSRLVESATEYVYVVDGYLDASLFDRYLFRVPDGVMVRLCTNPDNWNRKGWKEQFEQAEALFKIQHPEYERVDRVDLHARYLLTETGAWRIDGSIKDVAVAKDCPIHTIAPEERARILEDLFT